MKSARVRRARVSSRGFSVVYSVVLLVALFAFVSLAVDIGRVRLAKTELQVSADAAARGGADSLPVSSQAVIDAASDAASNNGVLDGSGNDHQGARINPGVELLPADDIEFGIWDPKLNTFAVLSDNGGTANDDRRKANAVHVTGRRISERGEPIPLIFGPVIGVFKSDIEREAIAYITGGPDKFGFVGLDGVRSTGNKATLDSVVLPNPARRNNGWIGSNGNIDLGNADVYGDARPGIGHQILQNPNSIITGWQANLDKPLVYPPDAFNPPNSNNNANISPFSAVIKGKVFNPKSNVTIPSGNYVFTSWKQTSSVTTTITAPANIWINGDFTMSGSGTLKINATGSNAVHFYVNGNFSQAGGNIINPGLPSALTISVTKAGTSVNSTGGTELRAHIYAPLSDVSAGIPAFYGWIIGKTLEFKGGSTQLHYDESRNNFVPYRITLVK